MSKDDKAAMKAAVEAIRTGGNPQIVLVGRPVLFDVLMEVVPAEDRLRLAELCSKGVGYTVTLHNGVTVTMTK